MWGLLRHLVVCVCLIIGNQAVAHSPYYTQTEQLAPIEGAAFAIKLLRGDGIMGPDPVRAIVVDEDGRIRAMSPLLKQPIIICRTDQDQRRCIVYDGADARIFETDPATWNVGEIVEEDQRPTAGAYPELMGQGFGFHARPATALEIVRFESAKVIADPLIAAISLVWWIGVALLLVPTLRQICVTRGDVRKWRAATIAWNVLRLLCFAGLAFVTAIWLLFGFSSPYYAAGFAALGILVAVLVIQPRRRRSEVFP